jgi:PKD repeat protein
VSDDPETPHVLVPVTLTVEIPCEPAEILSVTMEPDGCSVAFTAEVTGTGPIWYLWDFGPFGSYGMNPVVDFGETGTYTGTLEVGNCEGAGHDVYNLSVDVVCPWTVYLPVVMKNH